MSGRLLPIGKKDLWFSIPQPSKTPTIIQRTITIRTFNLRNGVRIVRKRGEAEAVAVAEVGREVADNRER